MVDRRHSRYSSAEEAVAAGVHVRAKREKPNFIPGRRLFIAAKDVLEEVHRDYPKLAGQPLFMDSEGNNSAGSRANVVLSELKGVDKAVFGPGIRISWQVFEQAGSVVRLGELLFSSGGMYLFETGLKGPTGITPETDGQTVFKIVDRMTRDFKHRKGIFDLKEDMQVDVPLFSGVNEDDRLLNITNPSLLNQITETIRFKGGVRAKYSLVPHYVTRAA